MKFKYKLKKTLRKNGKFDFLSKLKNNVSILDVGCGNNSPYEIKTILPQCYYTGIDIADHFQTKPVLADKYIITSAEKFSDEILKLSASFDVVISSHNLEHCNDRERTLKAMINALKNGGIMFLSFPSESSVNFPSRKGCLNYYDDPTHKSYPPKFEHTINTIVEHGLTIEYSEQSYSPIFLKLIGFFFEPLSRIMRKNMPGTWEYFGFESIIIAKRAGCGQLPISGSV